MAWVNIKNSQYYRRSRRVNGRVATQHLGGGEFGEMMASLDHSERMIRRMDAGLARVDRVVFGSTVRDVFEIGDFLGALFAVLARQSGLHQHHRQWRRTRRAINMSGTPFTKKELERLGRQLDQAQVRRAPLMEPSFEGLPEADRATLLAAAKGDTAALEKAKPYLTDPKYIRLWRNPMVAARCWLVGQVAGNDAVVATATHARVVMLQNELGFGTANMLEKLAITRIVHNWLAVAALDVRACQTPFQSRERTNVEKSLGQAERRLMSVIKTLAFLQECSAAAVMSRIGSATAM